MITRVKKMNPNLQSQIPTRYPNEFKKKVVIYAEKHNNSEAERIFGIAESNIRRWRKMRPIIFSKGFVPENIKRKRLIKKVSQNNADFIYETGKVDNMLSSTKKPIVKDYTRTSKVDSPSKIKLTAPSAVSPSMPTLPVQQHRTKDVDAEEVCLRWNSHHSNMKTSFPTLLQREQYVDVTLTSEGKSLKCHRLILSSCSAYFDELLSGISPTQHPVIFLNGVPFWVLKCLIDFMYAGEVHIEQNKLENLLRVAEMLQIKGLTGRASQTDEEKMPPRIIPVKMEKPVQEERTPVVKKEPTPVAKREPTPVAKREPTPVAKREPTPVSKREPTPAAKREPTPVAKKEQSTSTTPKSHIKRVLSPTLISPIDPLSLLEPTYFEENPVPLKFKEHIVKKIIPKKIKKRKSSEHEPSPPPILFRKGTKSRPHVKVPRYYHNDYEDLDGKKAPKKEEPTSSTSLEIPDVVKVQSDPLDIEDINVQMNEKRKSRDYLEKNKSKRNLDKILVTDELRDKENSENMIGTIDLDKEIKEERIDEDYIDIGDSQDHNITI